MTRILAAGMSGWVVCFGCWTVLSLTGIALHAPLSVVAPGLLACLLAGAFAAWWDYRAAPMEVGEPQWQEAPQASRIAILIAALALAALPFSGPGTLLPLWSIIAAATLATVLIRDNRASISSTRLRTGLPYSEEDLRAALTLLLAVLIGVGVTVLSNRSDADDYRYLWMAIRPRTMADDPIIYLYNPRLPFHPGRFAGPYTWHPYEVLAAALAYLGHLPAEASYYYLLPPLNALLTVVEFYLGARLFVGRQAALAALISTVLLVAWGESHRDIGNFAFVRLFQGKALLISWAVPMIFRFSVRFARERNTANAALLATAILAGCGTTHTGMVVAPLTALIGLFAGWTTGGTFVTLGIPAGAAALTTLATAAAVRFLPFGGERNPLTADVMLPQIFPPDARSVLALAAVGMSCLLLPPACRRLAGRALLIGVFLALNPFVMESLARFNDSLTWRVLWAFPFASFIGIGATAALAAEINRWRLPVLTGLAMVIFMVTGIWTVSTANGNHFGDLGLKADDTLKTWLRGDTTYYMERRLRP